jgi:hypothetical protein
MKKIFLGATIVAVVIGLNGCTGLNTADSSILDKTFEEYKAYKSHKAMAVAMGNDGRYAIGYSSDYSSQDGANKRAIKQCTDINNKSASKVNAECKIYAIDNEIVK